MSPEEIELLDDFIGKKIAELELQFHYKLIRGLEDANDKELFGRHISRLQAAHVAFKLEKGLEPCVKM